MPKITERPDVSIIVIAHDVRDEVLACLDSIERGADGLAVEVIVVDNGSRDDTSAAVRKRFPAAKVVTLLTNEGLPGRNHGLRRARGRVRMFLDSDALLTPGALSTLVADLDAHPEVGLVGPRLVYPDGSLQLSARRFPPLLLPVLRRPPLGRFFEDGRTIRRHLMADVTHERRRRVEYVLGACMAFREAAQQAAGEIDERIWFGHDDADWCFRIREAGYDVVYVPEAAVVHAYQRTSASKPVSTLALRFLLAHAYFQRKWMRRRRALVAAGRLMDAEALSSPAAGEPRGLT
ncbi:MAG: glycosyltransferase family 2 protein [Solirubrobacteraceae bacterium]